MREDSVVVTENFCKDLVVRKGNEIIIFDLTVHFGNGRDAFDEARKIKNDK